MIIQKWYENVLFTMKRKASWLHRRLHNLKEQAVEEEKHREEKTRARAKSRKNRKDEYQTVNQHQPSLKPEQHPHSRYEKYRNENQNY